MIDVAGQKSLRKKWIHFFEGVTAVIFFASLCGFDEALEEDPATVRPHTQYLVLSTCCLLSLSYEKSSSIFGVT